ncbi:MAG: hypothetical protein C0600_04545 [Ignavibacteria bacterium]|nr:MAG: hypothetical protein C0600_04545 [Ignavibacteria bacterium]
MGQQTPPAFPSDSRQWMIYGANGYTGRLIAVEAVRRGMKPVLAGRNESEILELATALDCPYRVFSLEDIDVATESLRDIHVVIHCAGPFSQTARPMIEACLAGGTHYMDVTGEIPVLEYLFSRSEEARAAGITALPGSGYDVVPTDCLAMMLKEQLPDAARLRLAFCGKIYQSPGTWKATLEALPRCGAVRKNGAIEKVPHVWKMQRLQFDHERCNTISIPWGDISSAWHSTGIPEIEVYGGVPFPSAITMRAIRTPICAIFRNRGVLRLSKILISNFVKGPDTRQRESGEYHLRGDAWNDRGEQRTLLMRTPEGYTTTVESTLAILPRVLDNGVQPGVWTPSQAFGSGFALTVPGIEMRSLPESSGSD